MNLQQQITNLSSLTHVSYDKDAKVADGSSAQTIFCSSWPTAKKVLEAIAAMIKNPIVKAIISMIITIGDGFETNICQQNANH